MRRVSTRDDWKAVSQVLDALNEGDLLKERLKLHLKVPGYLSIYAAYTDKQPASIAWTYFPHGQFAALSAGFQDRSSYIGLLAARLREIRERGYAFALIEANSLSRPSFEDYGFKHLTTIHSYHWNGN